MTTLATQHKRPRATRLVSGSAATLLRHSGFSKRLFQRQRGLRIVCYHGVCADDVAGRPWVPGYFVSAGAFARQMVILSHLGPIVHLPEVLPHLNSGTWDLPSCSAVTFDDVAACTFTQARRLLADFGVRATFFVSTGPATTGRLFNADIINLLRLKPELASDRDDATLGRILRRPADHKLMTAEQLRTALGDVEANLQQHLDATVRNTLRPMNWEEIRELAAAGHDIGGHTVDHAILGRQTDEARPAQIAGCADDIEREIGRRPIGFAYPNGGPDDFDESDYPALGTCGFHYAVSTRPGFCNSGFDLHALPRVCIDMQHTNDRFAMEVSGLLDRRRQRQQGWR